MSRDKISRFGWRAGFFFALMLGFFCLFRTEVAAAGMLVVEGGRFHYVAVQEEGKVYIVYANGEWVQFADGFGDIGCMAASPDNSLYVMSRNQKRLFMIKPNGNIHTVRKVDKIPQAIVVDRDGEVSFIHRAGVMAAVE